MRGGIIAGFRVAFCPAGLALVLSMEFFAAGPVLAADSAADQIAYGAYLSGECSTCHLSGKAIEGSDSEGHFNGVPGIVGLDSAHFIDAMMAYRSGERTNPAMVSAARALDEEQIAALAAYYASIAASR